jgi:sensor histidine kinase YesM
VYAQCIGQLICAGFLLLSAFVKNRPVQSVIVYIISYPTIVLAGFYIGRQLAGYILAQPARSQFDVPIMWTTLLITICVSTFSVWFYSARDRIATLKTEAAEEVARASQARLSMFQAQIEPHMLFNTLSNLRSLIDSDPQRALLMLDHLVDFLRATLKGSIHDFTSLKDEFNLLENYLSLMEIRMGERLRFRLNLPIVLENLSVPTLVLQPLVENAIKHGLEPTVDGGQIIVQAHEEDHCIAIEVLDTGVGYDTDAQPSSVGFGIQSVKDRLPAATANYDVLTIVSPPLHRQTGTSITIRFPLPTSVLQQV